MSETVKPISDEALAVVRVYVRTGRRLSEAESAALLARLDAAEAKRDRLAAALADRSGERCKFALECSTTEIERDQWRARNGSTSQSAEFDLPTILLQDKQIVELKAENAAMLRVVEAAMEWKRCEIGESQGIADAMDNLLSAVAAWEAEK